MTCKWVKMIGIWETFLPSWILAQRIQPEALGVGLQHISPILETSQFILVTHAGPESQCYVS